MLFAKGLTLLTLISFGQVALAGVSAYKSESSEQLYLQDDLNSKSNEAYLKFTGVSTPWSDKVIKVTHKNNKFSFKYFLDLSSGKKEQEFFIAVQDGSKRINGSDAKRVVLYLQNNKKIDFFYSSDLTANSEKMNLIQDFKKAPFTPEVD